MILTASNKSLFVLMLTIFCIGNCFSQNSPWELVKEKDGISLYTRSVKGSAIREVKAMMTLNSSIAAVVACVRDISSYPKWIFHCKEARVLQVYGDTGLIYYHVTSGIWPVADRDAISFYHIAYHQQSKTLEIRSHGIPDFLPKVEGKVRLPKSRTDWRITAVGPHKLQGEYILAFDPGGSIPAWIINFFVTEGPYTSLVKFRELLNDPKYKNAKGFGSEN